MEYKIMLVEDDASIAKLLSSHIEKYGYKPIIVNDFDRILDLLRKILTLSCLISICPSTMAFIGVER